MSIFSNNIKGFHLELTNICTLKCPACPRTQFLETFPKHWKNQNINLENLKNFLDVDLTGIVFNLCGNYGDPIYYPNIIDLCKWLKSKKAIISITTNGSYQKEKFWKDLSAVLTVEDEVTWSIDGTPDNFTQYRINADWESIEQGINIITQSDIKTSWKYIVFNFNESTVEQAQELSVKLGIDEFIIHRSDRWADVPNLKPSSSWIGTRHSSQKEYVNGHRNMEVSPECSNGKMHFISAEGFYSPCCYTSLHQFRYKSVWGKKETKHKFDISKRSITQILQDDIVSSFDKSIRENPEDVCKFQCPK